MRTQVLHKLVRCIVGMSHALHMHGHKKFDFGETPKFKPQVTEVDKVGLMSYNAV